MASSYKGDMYAKPISVLTLAQVRAYPLQIVYAACLFSQVNCSSRTQHIRNYD